MVSHFKDSTTTPVRAGKLRNLTAQALDVKWHPATAFRHWIATASYAGEVVLWNVERNNGPSAKERQFKQPGSISLNIGSGRLCWTANPHLIVSCFRDNYVRLWDVRKHTVARQFQLSPQTSTKANDVHCDLVHNENRFAVGLRDGSVQIWDQRRASKRQLMLQAHACDREVYALEWHPKLPNVLATGSRDMSIKVWHLGRSISEPLTTIATDCQIHRVKWRPDHRYQLMSCSKIDKHISIWNIKRPYMPVAQLLQKSNAYRIETTDVEWLLPPNSNSHGRPDKFCRSVVISSSDRESDTRQIMGNVSLHDPREAYRPFEGMRTIAIASHYTGNLDMCYNNYELSDARLDFEYENDPDSDSETTSTSIGDPEQNNGEQPLFSLPSFMHQGPGAFDPVKFVSLARNYRLTGDSVFALCKHNGRIALQNGCKEIAAAWRCLQNMYRDFAPRDEFSVLAGSKGKTAADLPLTERAAMQLEHDLGTNFLPEMVDNDLYTANADKAGMNSLSAFRHYTVAWFADTHAEIEKSLILNFAKNREIDVQTAVSFICVLINGDAERGDNVYPPWLSSLESLMSEWFEFYIDLLRRCNLEATALEVSSLGSASVALPKHLQDLLRPEKDTLGKIETTEPKTGEMPINMCAVCELPIRAGLQVWCQGCGHGGHFECIRDWFKDCVFCPSGCGHACDFGALSDE